jgi:uncharacterized protein (TIGR04255 family)
VSRTVSEPLAYPKLDRPPINEVICGFIFEPAPVDVLDFGVYWERRRGDFPNKELHPALFDEGPIINFRGGMLTRAWFVSELGDVLLQLQHDRFYMNWRARGTDYPRFSDRDGNRGLKSYAVEEWKRFLSFITERTGAPTVKLLRIELAKVDVLERGKHWVDHQDLGTLMKVATVFNDIQLKDPAHLQLRLTESDDNKAALVTVNITDLQARIEARVIVQASDDIDGLLTHANERVNAAFFGLLNRAEMKTRFGISA